MGADKQFKPGGSENFLMHQCPLIQTLQKIWCDWIEAYSSYRNEMLEKPDSQDFYRPRSSDG